MAKGYAYRGKSGVLHVIRDATKQAREGLRVVEYEGDFDNGYPLTAGGKAIVDEGNGLIFVGDNSKSGTPLSKCDSGVRAEVVGILQKIGL